MLKLSFFLTLTEDIELIHIIYTVLIKYSKNVQFETLRFVGTGLARRLQKMRERGSVYLMLLFHIACLQYIGYVSFPAIDAIYGVLI